MKKNLYAISMLFCLSFNTSVYSNVELEKLEKFYALEAEEFIELSMAKELRISEMHRLMYFQDADELDMILPEGRECRVEDFRDAHNRTPLHWAVLIGWLQAVRCLVAGGASLQARDKFNKTPCDYAREKNCRLLLGAVQGSCVGERGES
ncbi:MAG: hypothetical protein H6679_00810 [Epsilonproteobacteria bacterium]|nr:hypothetical protein [Campylobacterota bacterium]